jgi:hypothetical protein
VRIWAGDQRLPTVHVGHGRKLYEYYKVIVKERKKAKREKKRRDQE